MTQVLAGTMALDFGATRGELPGAIELAARNMTVAEELGAPNLRAAVRSGLARAHALRGDWQEAARLFEESVALANEHRTFLEGEGPRPGVPRQCLRRDRRAGARQSDSRTRRRLGEGSGLEDPGARERVALARGEALIAEMRAVAFRPHLAEIRAERARRHGDQTGWRAQLAEAHRLFTETGATGHAARVARTLQEHGT